MGKLRIALDDVYFLSSDTNNLHGAESCASHALENRRTTNAERRIESP